MFYLFASIFLQSFIDGAQTELLNHWLKVPKKIEIKPTIAITIYA